MYAIFIWLVCVYTFVWCISETKPILIDIWMLENNSALNFFFPFERHAIESYLNITHDCFFWMSWSFSGNYSACIAHSEFRNPKVAWRRFSAFTHGLFLSTIFYVPFMKPKTFLIHHYSQAFYIPISKMCSWNEWKRGRRKKERKEEKKSAFFFLRF